MIFETTVCTSQRVLEKARVLDWLIQLLRKIKAVGWHVVTL